MPYTGKVIDSTGSPLIGASVKIKGTNKVTKTNDQGVFSLEKASTSAPVVVVSFVGFADKEVTVSNSGNIVVTLLQKIAETQDVIVTGVFDRRTACNLQLLSAHLKAPILQSLHLTVQQTC
jgi:hypothetical protein